MQIHLNAEPRELEAGTTIEALLQAFRLDVRKVAVEVNLAIVPRSLYSQTQIHDGDQIEIVRFIGGG